MCWFTTRNRITNLEKECLINSKQQMEINSVFLLFCVRRLEICYTLAFAIQSKWPQTLEHFSTFVSFRSFQSAGGFKSLKSFCWSFARFAIVIADHDLCWNEVKMRFHLLFLFVPLFYLANKSTTKANAFMSTIKTGSKRRTFTYYKRIKKIQYFFPASINFLLLIRNFRFLYLKIENQLTYNMLSSLWKIPLFMLNIRNLFGTRANGF